MTPFYKKIIPLFVLLCSMFYSLTAKAGEEPYMNFIKGKLKVNDTLVVKDEKFRNPFYNWNDITNIAVNNTITLRLLDEIAIPETFTCKVELKIEYFETPDQTSPTIVDSVKLQVSHATDQGAFYKLTDSYTFKNGYMVKVTVKKVFSPELGFDLPPYFQLSSSIVINRQYNFKPGQNLHVFSSEPVATVIAEPATSNEGIKDSVNLNTANEADVTTDGTEPETNTRSGDTRRLASNSNVTATLTNQLNLTWDPITGAEEYDIEWTTLDEDTLVNTTTRDIIKYNQNPASAPAVSDSRLNEIFRNNATRITTAGQSYQLSLVYDNKYLMMRMRQVHYTNGIRIEGPWDYKVNTNSQELYAFWTLTWHQEKYNWQYSAAFAEEGKKKEVVSYFDGTLRNRQTATMANAEAVPVLLIQENIYDEFGRPTASILPAPYKEANTYFRYMRGFNRNAGNKAYNATNINTALCEISPELLSKAAGAAQYYSSSSTFINDKPFNKYIPDAGQLPISVTQYTPDNTGRIKIQGGVGPTFQPGPSQTHTTKYFYGKPEQWELDRIFGNDVGYAEHYQKNTVVDPNGQISISYLNASGKTIATALTGEKPVNLAKIGPPLGTSVADTADAAEIKSINLLKPGQFTFDNSNLKLSATTTYIATTAGIADFKFDIEKLILTYTNAGYPICSKCYYDIKVTVKDDCGDSFLPDNAQELVFPLDTSGPDSCNITAKPPMAFTTRQLNVGAYYITFEFALSKREIEDNVDKYVAQNRSLKTEGAFIFDYLQTLDFTSCLSDCRTCVEVLGSETNFTNMLADKLSKSGVNMSTLGTDYTAWVHGKYLTLKADCDARSAACPFSSCDVFRQQLLEDVSPGGQYALFGKNGGALDPAVNVLSLYLHTAFPVAAVGSTQYNSELITLPDGTETSPYDASFTVAQMIVYWKASWADKFVQYHPEYCKLQFCDNNATFKSWDERLKTKLAKDVNYTKNVVTLSNENHTWLLSTDDFFKPAGPGAIYYNDMLADLQSYSVRILNQPDLSPTKSLLKFVLFQVYCAGDPASGTNMIASVSGNPPNYWEYCSPVDTCRILEREWQAYREYYLELKERYYKKLRDATSCAGKCTEIGTPVSIQVPGQCATVNDFSISTYSGAKTPPCDAGMQTLALRHKGGLQSTVHVNLLYPGGMNTAGLPADVVVTAANPVYLFCVPAGIPVNSIKISGVYCTSNFVAKPYCCFQYTYGKSNANYGSEGTIIQPSPGAAFNQLNAGTVWGGNGGSNFTAQPEDNFSATDSLQTNMVADGGFTTNAVIDCSLRDMTTCATNPKPAANPTWPLNRAGIWAATPMEKNLNETIGFEKSIYVPESKQYFFGYAADNQIKVNVDNKSVAFGENFRKWTIIPYYLTKGRHLLHVEFKNSCTQDAINPAVIGLEIYNDTSARLSTLADTSQLKLIFSTAWLRGPTPVEPVQSFRIPGSDTIKDWHLTNADGSYYNVNANQLSPQPPVVGTPGCPAALAGKVSRFDLVDKSNPLIYAEGAGYKSTGVGDAYANAANEELVNQAKSNCETNADNWMALLEDGLMARYPNAADVTLRDQKRIELKAALIAICKSGCDINHPYGTSSTNGTVAGVYANFGVAIKSVLTLTKFTSLLNPYLIDGPMPYNVKQQVILPVISKTSTAICDTLAKYKLTYTTDVALYTYLGITQAQLSMLNKACTNCKFLLPEDMRLPALLDPDKKACLSAAQYNNDKAALIASFDTSLVDSSYNYPIILANYFNQKYGYALGYNQYQAFESSGANKLCNTPPNTDVEYDDYDCIKVQLAIAVANGKQDYAAYIEEQKNLFRLAYVNKCAGAKAYVNIEALQRLYHYTLYYYDQADNLIRTIPPEGVKLLTDTERSWVEQARGYDPAACASEAVSCGGTPVTYSTDKTTGFNSLSTKLAATGATALEFWFFNSNYQDDIQLIQATPDRNFMYQLSINKNVIGVDQYSISQSADQTSVSITASAHWRAAFTDAMLTNRWVHVVVQRTGSAAAQQIYLNGNALTVTTAATPMSPGWAITTAGDGTLIYPDVMAKLKHMRLYTRVLSTTEIRNNAVNDCFKPTNACNMLWYRFNVPAAGSETTIASNSTVETRRPPYFPDHWLRTNNIYNATNQVIQQFSPDGNYNWFWYDMLSRLVISRNSKQLAANPDKYSYTTYDNLGRITEVGEKQTGTSISTPNYLSSTAITGFMASGTNAQITQTVYDAPAAATAGNGVLSGLTQNNLRKRVAASLYFENPGETVTSGMYYNYDLDGNVSTMYRQIPGLGTKKIDYEYDLISGKVNFVGYQAGQPDQFYYQYDYDAENRITAAWSSPLANITPYGRGSTLNAGRKRLDASYQYYLHGPLARMELGDVNGKVQGVDYAYTLQGWLKGVNGNVLSPAKDMGNDGATGGKDVMAYSLNYFPGDYTAIGNTTTTAFKMNYQPQAGDATGQALYNGNISGSTLALAQVNSNLPVGYTYGYDQLNRLRGTRQHNLTDATTSWNSGSIVPAFSESATYDGNGNILKYLRNGDNATTPLMDNLTYAYPLTGGRLTNNRLSRVDDTVTPAAYANDIDDQNTNNYLYDDIGNIKADVKAGVTNIDWSVYGKIKYVAKGADTIRYRYDPAGNRQSKTTIGTNPYTTYYVRDAQGNTLAVYDNQNNTTNWREQHLYGSNRIGLWQPNENLATNNALAIWDEAGHKQYELSNHLGNVLATISDKRTLVSGSYQADVLTAQDYYPFGMLQPGRAYLAPTGSNYRYGFNGKENDNEVKGNGNQQDYGMRIYDPRVGRFLSVDPLTEDYPQLTPYQFSSNSPIKFIDLDGMEAIDHSKKDLLLLGNTKFDMSKAPDKFQTASGRWVYTTINALGQKRNSAYYWAQILENHPEFFDAKNIAKISEGRSPIANKQWVKFNKSHTPWIGQLLEHHHYDHGSEAYALPWKAHRGKGNYNLWHKSPNSLNEMKGLSKNTALSYLPILDPSEYSGYWAKRPNSFFMQMESLRNPQVGVVYENSSSTFPGNYFVIREKSQEYGLTKYVIDYYGELKDGYQQVNEDSFKSQKTYYYDKDGKEANIN